MSANLKKIFVGASINLDAKPENLKKDEIFTLMNGKTVYNENINSSVDRIENVAGTYQVTEYNNADNNFILLGKTTYNFNGKIRIVGIYYKINNPTENFIGIIEEESYDNPENIYTVVKNENNIFDFFTTEYFIVPQVIDKYLIFCDGVRMYNINIEAGIKKYHPDYATNIPPYRELNYGTISLNKLADDPFGLKTVPYGTLNRVSNKFSSNRYQFFIRYIYDDYSYTPIFSYFDPYYSTPLNDDETNVTLVNIRWGTGATLDTIYLQKKRINTVFVNYYDIIIHNNYVVDQKNVREIQIIAFNITTNQKYVFARVSRDDPQYFNFFNSNRGNTIVITFNPDQIPIEILSTEDSVNEFDNIPDSVYAISSYNNRLFLGNNTYNNIFNEYKTIADGLFISSHNGGIYDEVTVPITRSGNIIQTSTVGVILRRTFFYGVNLYFSIVYYDEFGKKSLVNPNIIKYTYNHVITPRVYEYDKDPNLILPTPNATTTDIYATYLPTKSNNIPDWAKYYKIVMAHDTPTKIISHVVPINYRSGSISNEFSFGVSYIIERYVFNNETKKYDIKYELSLAPNLDLSNYLGLGISLRALIYSGGGYQYTAGDYLRLYYFDGVTTTVLVTAPIIAVIEPSLEDETIPYVVVSLDPTVIPPRLTYIIEVFQFIKALCWFEIFTPNNLSSSNLVYYDVSPLTSKNLPLSIKINGNLEIKIIGNQKFYYPGGADGQLFQCLFFLPCFSKNKIINDISFNPYGWGNLLYQGVQQINIISNEMVITNEITINNSYNGLNKVKAGNTVYYGNSDDFITTILPSQEGEYQNIIFKIILRNGKTISQYINTREIINAGDGTRNLSVSDNLIGTSHQLPNSYGCDMPEAVTLYKNKIWFIDDRNYDLIQDDPNGQSDISKILNISIFIQKYFEIYRSLTIDKIKELNTVGNVDYLYRVAFGVNQNLNELYISFPRIIEDNEIINYPNLPLDDNNKKIQRFNTDKYYNADLSDFRNLFLGCTIIINTNINKVVGILEQVFEAFSSDGNLVYAFYNGDWHKLNYDTSRWQTFFGEYKPLKIGFIFNELTYNTSNFVGFLIRNNFNIKPTYAVFITYSNGRYLTSIASVNNFRNFQNNEVTCPIMRSLSNNIETFTNDLFKGRLLKGQYLKVIVYFDKNISPKNDGDKPFENILNTKIVFNECEAIIEPDKTSNKN